MFLRSQKSDCPILGTRGHIYKMGRLEWYQHWEEELLIAPVHFCPEATPVRACANVKVWVWFYICAPRFLSVQTQLFEL